MKLPAHRINGYQLILGVAAFNPFPSPIRARELIFTCFSDLWNEGDLNIQSLNLV
jgi:hypothetical protein